MGRSSDRRECLAARNSVYTPRASAKTRSALTTFKSSAESSMLSAPQIIMAPSSTSQPRRSRVLACEPCRSRRTRCDGERPSCNACETRGITCEYPEVPERTAPDIESELAYMRAQLNRIEVALETLHSNGRDVVDAAAAHSSVRDVVDAVPPNEASPRSLLARASASSTSPHGLPPKDFPIMQVKNEPFLRLAGLESDFGDHLLRRERAKPGIAPPLNGPSVFQHSHILAALHSYSENVHPWYPILESDFSASISMCLSNSFSPGTTSCLVLMMLASGAVAQHPNQSEAFESRPDAIYLHLALGMIHVVLLEQSLRSVQCLAAASIHYYLLLRPIQAHDLAVLAIKKAQDLQISGALDDDGCSMEHWIRVYRTILLVEGELVVPLRLSETTAWETEEEILLPNAAETWSAASPTATGEDGSTDKQPTEAVTYLLAEIAMRRMLRRNTTSITVSGPGTVEYAPLIARELQAQLHQWYNFLPSSLRFPRDFEDSQDLSSRSPQAVFLCAQYWACMVSISWPSVFKVIESQHISQEIITECRSFFYSFRQFIKSATAALEVCLPNKWTILASIFAISIGAYLGASNPALASVASDETWATLHVARDAFGDECQYSPSLSYMREKMYDALPPHLIAGSR